MEFSADTSFEMLNCRIFDYLISGLITYFILYNLALLDKERLCIFLNKSMRSFLYFHMTISSKD